MKKVILILGSIVASLAIISIPVLLVCSITLSWSYEALALFTILTTIEFIILVSVIYELAKTEDEYMTGEEI